jgi:hypothetical protein
MESWSKYLFLGGESVVCVVLKKTAIKLLSYIQLNVNSKIRGMLWKSFILRSDQNFAHVVDQTGGSWNRRFSFGISRSLFYDFQFPEQNFELISRSVSKVPVVVRLRLVVNSKYVS